MKFSDRFLSAIGGWQRGWHEDKAQREMRAEELEAATETESLPSNFRCAKEVCYRKRFLVPSNPQNGGDLGPLFLNGFIEEGLSSWTTDRRFAQDFKDPLRGGAFAAVFAHLPQPGEVLVNIPALWADNAFEWAANTFAARGGCNSDALMHFRFRQGEIVMNADLRYEEVAGICGRSSPFDILCEAAGLKTDDERDEFWRRLVETNRFPEEPLWLTKETTRAVLDKVKDDFLTKHSEKIGDVLSKQSTESHPSVSN